MTGDWWFWIALGSAIAYATKLLGYMVPARWLHHPRMARVAGSLTVALLAALTAMNTVASGQQLVLDARVAALVVAGIALVLRLPFLLVVVLGAAASALVRWLL
jgi:uncharacterized membrane protein